MKRNGEEMRNLVEGKNGIKGKDRETRRKYVNSH